MDTQRPRAEITEFCARERRYALIIGVHNEGERFTRQIEALQPYRQLADIIVADGGSTDGAASPGALQGKVRALLINRDAQRGLSVQYRIALRYALEQGYAGVIMMDGNGKDGVEAIPHFIGKLTEGFGFIQGSRFLPGGRHAHTPPLRVFGIRRVFNPLMRLACGFAYTDGMNGFKACSAELLSHPRVQPLRDVFVRYGLQYFLNYSAPRTGLPIAEIPVSRCYDGARHSKITGPAAYLRILAELLSTVTGRYDP